MKNRILKIVISFIFLFAIFYVESLATMNEIIEDVNIRNEEIEQNLIEQENELKLELIYQENLNGKYNGEMYLDEPAQNASFTRPDDTKMKIQGWAVSEDSEARIRILVDGNVVTENAGRLKRPDVDQIISPNYGGIVNTPNAGFCETVDISNLDRGTHQVRIEEISRLGDVIASYESQFQIVNRKYNGEMYLDEPAQNARFTRPDDMKIKIQGWAVSEDSGARVRILVDGNVVTENAGRLKRSDVDQIISPNYGGIVNTPNAGFCETVDISNLDRGTHQLRIEEISRLGDVIASFESQFQVVNKKYKGEMYLDEPVQNASFTRPDDTKMKIEGWAVSEDYSARVRILIDGNVVTENAGRLKRPDVDEIISPNYGGIVNTPNAGFCEIVDISKLDKGTHQVRIEEISRFGDVIASFEIQFQVVNKKYKGEMYLDEPVQNASFTRPDDTKMKVHGWAVSEDSGARVRILIDGNVVTENAGRLKRPDVDQIISPNYGGTANTLNAGFCETVDISNLDKGTHTIRIEEISRFGDLIVSFEIQFQVVNKKYKGEMYLDEPVQNASFTRPDDTKMKVHGWAVSEDSGARVRILIDGNVVTENAGRLKRSDVDQIISPNYGGIVNTPNAGFCETVDISNLDKGTHTIRIEEISRFGDVIASFESHFQVVNKKYLAEMCIDTPTFNTSYTSGQNIIVSGWAVAEDELATVEIYVDNQLKAVAGRYYREDVVHYMNKYGGKTVNAGFGKNISSSGLAAGVHKLTVYEKSRYGDIIGGVEVPFIVNKPVSNNDTSIVVPENNNDSIDYSSGVKGIDVSQHQGTIDWAKVANSGIEFAMIRIGYRGYATGGFAEDTKFKTNFKNAVQNGLKVGIYYYSTAINTDEAKKDAEYVMSLLKKYGYQNMVSMPIAIDLEVNSSNVRDYNVSKTMRTNIANTFCSTIANYGYTPMVYACKAFLNGNIYPNKIPYDIWVAQYNSKCTYSGKYTMWQYTSSGRVSGISGNVDCNICYKNY